MSSTAHPQSFGWFHFGRLNPLENKHQIFASIAIWNMVVFSEMFPVSSEDTQNCSCIMSIWVYVFCVFNSCFSILMMYPVLIVWRRMTSFWSFWKQHKKRLTETERKFWKCASGGRELQKFQIKNYSFFSLHRFRSDAPQTYLTLECYNKLMSIVSAFLFCLEEWWTSELATVTTSEDA